jgi:glycosyltransferase involved in cell wall biosynthesis
MEILDYKIYSNQKILESKNIRITPKITLLIGFYNNIKFFDMMFASIEKQTFRDFEVIICDDGSKPEVVEHVHRYMKKTPILIQHLWQEDQGFKKPELLNKAMLTSTDYLILVDQDCMLHPEFIREHYENREPNTILSGRRAELSPFITKLLTPQKIKDGFIQKNYWWMLFFMFFRKDNQWDKGVYIRNRFLRNFFNRKPRALVGCNFSFFRENLIRVNGFDMSHTISCGSEDTDVEFRLLLDNVKIKPFCHSAVQYHLYHPIRKSGAGLPEVYAKYRQEKIKFIPVGYNSLTPASKTELKSEMN